MTRANYSLVETGKRKDVLDPDRAVKLARLLNVELFDLVVANGFPLRQTGPLSPKAMAVARAFDEAAPSVQDHVARGLGVDT